MIDERLTLLHRRADAHTRGRSRHTVTDPKLLRAIDAIEKYLGGRPDKMFRNPDGKWKPSGKEARYPFKEE
ncbi:MAG: hypothetical protein GC131_09035 [Alphaproteobacteria bacterium]|nr:hypothetical protein [Alphaproteobacteria bacterium]